MLIISTDISKSKIHQVLQHNRSNLQNSQSSKENVPSIHKSHIKWHQISPKCHIVNCPLHISLFCSFVVTNLIYYSSITFSCPINCNEVPWFKEVYLYHKCLLSSRYQCYRPYHSWNVWGEYPSISSIKTQCLHSNTCIFW